MSAFSDFVGDGLDKLKASSKNPILEPIGYKRADPAKGQGPVLGEPAQYDLTVNRATFGKSQKNGTPFFAVEFDVDGSNNPTIQKGTQASFVVSFGQYPDMGKRAILGLLMRGLSMDEEEAKSAITKDLITGKEQILSGEKLKCTVMGATSPKTGKAFVDYRWAPAA